MAPALKRSLALLSLAFSLGFAGSALASTGPTCPSPDTRSVPEFDGKSSGSAAALLLGGVLLVVDRRRRTRDLKV
jgi:beta-lactam-binding protein with PASTA domain